MSTSYDPLFPDLVDSERRFPELVDSERRRTTNWISPQQPPVAAEWYNLLCSQVMNEQRETAQWKQHLMPRMQLCDNPLTPDYTEEELRELRHRAQLDEAAQSTAAAFGMAIEQVRDQLAAATRVPAALLFGDPPTSLGYTALPQYMWETQYQCVPTEPAAPDSWGSWIMPRVPAAKYRNWQKSDAEYRARARTAFMHSRRNDVASHVSQTIAAQSAAVDAEYRTPRRLSDVEINALVSDGLHDFLGSSSKASK